MRVSVFWRFLLVCFFHFVGVGEANVFWSVVFFRFVCLFLFLPFFHGLDGLILVHLCVLMFILRFFLVEFMILLFLAFILFSVIFKRPISFFLSRGDFSRDICFHLYMMCIFPCFGNTFLLFVHIFLYCYLNGEVESTRHHHHHHHPHYYYWCCAS